MSANAAANPIQALHKARSTLAQALAAACEPPRERLLFNDADVDGCLGGGLVLGRWHEIGGEGLEGETAAAPGAFSALIVGAIVRRADAAGGVAAWIGRRDDLHGPGLVQLGVPIERLILIKAPDETGVLAAMEEAARAAGVVAVVGEVAGVDLVAGRRLQLACETGGATVLLVRRRPFGGPSRNAAAKSGGAASRWRIAGAPSETFFGEPGLGPPRWRVALERCRGGRPGAWIMEKSDAAFPLRVVARLGDRDLEAAPSFRLAG